MERVKESVRACASYSAPANSNCLSPSPYPSISLSLSLSPSLSLSLRFNLIIALVVLLFFHLHNNCKGKKEGEEMSIVLLSWTDKCFCVRVHDTGRSEEEKVNRTKEKQKNREIAFFSIDSCEEFF